MRQRLWSQLDGAEQQRCEHVGLNYPSFDGMPRQHPSQRRTTSPGATARVIVELREARRGHRTDSAGRHDKLQAQGNPATVDSLDATTQAPGLRQTQPSPPTSCKAAKIRPGQGRPQDAVHRSPGHTVVACDDLGTMM